MKNLKKVLLLLIVGLTFNGFSQSIGDYYDVVHLNNGSTIRGIIIEQIPGQSIKIRLNDGSEMVFQVSEVAKFTRETSSGNIMNTSSAKNDNNNVVDSNKVKWMDIFKEKKKGYFFEADVLMGGTGTALRVTNGYRFGRFGILGLALGSENLNPDNNGYVNYSAISLNIVYSGEILNKRVTPFYQIEAGYGVSLNREANRGFEYDHGIDETSFYARNDKLYFGGPMAAAQFGVKFKTKRKIVYKLGLDTRVVSSFTEQNIPTKSFGMVSNSSMGIRFGIGF